MPETLLHAARAASAAGSRMRTVLWAPGGGLPSATAAAWTIFIVTRGPVLSGLNRIPGDTLDAELARGIELHWSNVLSGSAIDWRTTDYPVRDTLGHLLAVAVAIMWPSGRSSHAVAAQ